MDYSAAITAIARWVSRNIYSGAKPALVQGLSEDGSRSPEQQAAFDRAIREGVKVVTIARRDARVRRLENIDAK